MAKFEIQNTSNVRKFAYGHQLEPGEAKEVEILVKEADELPETKFDVKRLDGAGEESADQDGEPTGEVEAREEASLDKNPEQNSGGE